MKMITEFFAGERMHIEPYDFLNVINSIVNDDFKLQYLSQEDFLKQLRIALDNLPPPRITGETSGQRLIYRPSHER